MKSTPLRTHAPSFLNRRAASEVFAKVMVLVILISLSGFAYAWGTGLIGAQDKRSEVGDISAKLQELKSKMTEVANAGNGSVRFVDLSINHGTILIEPGEPCSSSLPYSNMIRYALSASSRFFESTAWALSDPNDRSMACTAPSENSSSGILVSRATTTGGEWSNEFALWFRTINQSASTSTFLINVTTNSANSEIKLTSGQHTLRIESLGNYQAGAKYYTKVKVSEAND